MRGFAAPRVFARSFATRPLPRPRDPLSTSKNAEHYEITPNVTFIHRPPPTAPTPHSLTTLPASPLLRPRPPPAEAAAVVPPLLKPRKEVQRTHLSKAQIEEIQRLRAEDPETHTRQKLALKYNCSPLFVGMIAPLKKEMHEKIGEALEKQKEKWGERKKVAREVRKRRKAHW